MPTCDACGNWLTKAEAARLELTCPKCGGVMSTNKVASLGVRRDSPGSTAAPQVENEPEYDFFEESAFWRGFRIGCPIAPVLLLSLGIGVARAIVTARRASSRSRIAVRNNHHSPASTDHRGRSSH